ncbi:YhgE/Pip domain-containing protein [Maritimibacter dapengensis]|uniref:ABC-2 type transporter transmembrane domain-containing protein n=1 Tax=Maritimibacter dapengensis TaxID=2836868 RepID=A0ABS6T6G8_9RHOB|nr:ABC transporter permease [Maritimibacter dapengensis]MBV7380298.1 hypothetical protein [Maritimibacter dapengensis]
MKQLMHSFLSAPTARPALIVPALVMIVFSLFTLTAPMDPARSAASITLGIVNEDAGLPMPPIKVSERMLQGLSGQLPFQTQAFDSRADAEAALAAGDISVVLHFPEDFSQNAMRGDQAVFDIVTGSHLTVAEVQVTQQLQQMLPAAMSAGVASMKLAISQGQMPSGQMPVAANVTALGEPADMAAVQAPFAMLYTTWLASFVGAVMMTLATRGRADRGTMATTRSVLPVLSTGLAALCLALVVGFTVDWGAALPAWLAVWPTALALTWLLTGLLSLLGLWVIVLILPLVFYQSAIGGVMAPTAAAPAWLADTIGALGLDQIGAAYRAAVHGMGAAYPLVLIATIAILGLALIWIKAALPARQQAGATA